MTVQDIANNALMELGVSSPWQGANTLDLALALSRINLILDSWSTQADLLYYTSESAFTTTNGTANYTFPSSATNNLATPVKIDRVMIGSTGSRTDLQERSWYGEGPTTGSAAGTPASYTYYRQFPAQTGNLQFQPIPNGTYIITLNYWASFPQYVALTDTVTLPPGYTKALCLQLAIEMAPAFEVDPTRLQVTTQNWQNILTSLKGTSVDGPRNTSEKAL
jgi:hypothetical protein